MVYKSPKEIEILNMISNCAEDPKEIDKLVDFLRDKKIFYLAIQIIPIINSKKHNLKPTNTYYVTVVEKDPETGEEIAYIPFCYTKEEAKEAIKKFDLRNKGVTVTPECGYDFFISLAKGFKSARFQPLGEKFVHFSTPMIQKIANNLLNPNQILYNELVDKYTNSFYKKMERFALPCQLPENIVDLTDLAKISFSDHLIFPEALNENLQSFESTAITPTSSTILWRIFSSLAINLFVMVFHENIFSREEFSKKTGLAILLPDEIESSDLLTIDSTINYKVTDLLKRKISLNFSIIPDDKKFRINSIEYTEKTNNNASALQVPALQ
jgi:hypothetical protein